MTGCGQDSNQHIGRHCRGRELPGVFCVGSRVVVRQDHRRIAVDALLREQLLDWVFGLQCGEFEPLYFLERFSGNRL